MEKFPKINNEDDLSFYDSYLKGSNPKNTELVGKYARIEFIFSNRKEIKYGKILEINEEHIVLKIPKTKSTLYCDAKRVSFIYILN